MNRGVVAGGPLWIFDADRAEGYRMVFRGEGRKITGELYELSNLNSPLKVLTTQTAVVSGFPHLSLRADLGSTAAQPYEMTVDNYSFTGTLP